MQGRVADKKQARAIGLILVCCWYCVAVFCALEVLHQFAHRIDASLADFCDELLQRDHAGHMEEQHPVEHGVDVADIGELENRFEAVCTLTLFSFIQAEEVGAVAFEVDAHRPLGEVESAIVDLEVEAISEQVVASLIIKIWVDQ